MTANDIIAAHPVPWRHRVQGGFVNVFDANNRNVELFTMVEFLQLVTADISMAQATPAPAPQAA